MVNNPSWKETDQSAARRGVELGVTEKQLPQAVRGGT